MKAERKFEEEWRETFEGAEVTPSDAVWTGIDLELANAESSSMKKRIVFYQRLAAASILFALLVGGFGLYRWNETEKLVAYKSNTNVKAPENKTSTQEEKKPIADHSQTENAGNANSSASTASVKKDQTEVSGEANKKSISNPKQETTESFAVTKNQSSESLQRSNNAAIPNGNKLPVKTFAVTKLAVNENNTDPQKENHFSVALAAIPEAGVLPLIEVDGEPVQEELVRKLPAIPAAFMIEPHSEKINHERLWASVTAATGSYSTVATSNSLYGSSSFQSASAGSSNAGSSYSYGMLAGMRVSNRIVIQSGVQYSNQSAGTTTNINAPSSLYAVANYSSNSLASPANFSSPYAITSANEFISVPVQAGYLFVDRKIGLQLNSGISTDFFVRNTLSDPSGQRQSYSQGAGQDSPYRAVNFSGLMSSEVSYKLGRHYRLSLVPGVRYSFAPVLKSANTATGNNMVWDIGFRFRYIFK